MYKIWVPRQVCLEFIYNAMNQFFYLKTSGKVIILQTVFTFIFNVANFTTVAILA